MGSLLFQLSYSGIAETQTTFCRITNENRVAIGAKAQNGCIAQLDCARVPTFFLRPVLGAGISNSKLEKLLQIVNSSCYKCATYPVV